MCVVSGVVFGGGGVLMDGSFCILVSLPGSNNITQRSTLAL